MYIQQLYTGCLAQAAYYIESDREAVVIDPMRESEPYLSLAQSRGAVIRYVFESHFHADFVSGHLELSRKTGAKIVYGPDATPGFDAHVATDHEIIRFGHLSIEVLHTPGHTIESSCFLLRDENGTPHCIFTGDTLFVGDVGRPDLLSGNLDKETLGGMLFDSLNSKIKTLADHVIVYPGHGAGSACGKNLGKKTVSTIGEQKATNYALRDMPREEFIKVVTDGQPLPPAYFFSDAKINKTGYGSLDDVMQQSMTPLDCPAVEKLLHEEIVILDTRPAEIFAQGFIPGSLNIGLNGDFAVWAGTLIPFGAKLVLVTEENREHETALRLARIGYENISGFLHGSFETWKRSGRAIDSIPSLRPAEAEAAVKQNQYVLLDVRRHAEVANSTIPGSIHIPLNELKNRLNELNPAAHYLIYCAGGYRSMMAASIMEREGFPHTVNLAGGINSAAKETQGWVVTAETVS